MAYTTEDILGEFIDVARIANYVTSVSSFEDMIEQQARYDRARWLRGYHRLHAKPEWRKARAAKMRVYRARLKAEKLEAIRKE